MLLLVAALLILAALMAARAAILCEEKKHETLHFVSAAYRNILPVCYGLRRYISTRADGDTGTDGQDSICRQQLYLLEQWP